MALTLIQREPKNGKQSESKMIDELDDYEVHRTMNMNFNQNKCE